MPVLLSDCLLIVVVQSLSHVQLFATPWTAAHQAPLSFTVSRSLLSQLYSLIQQHHSYDALYFMKLFFPHQVADYIFQRWPHQYVYPIPHHRLTRSLSFLWRGEGSVFPLFESQWDYDGCDRGKMTDGVCVTSGSVSCLIRHFRFTVPPCCEEALRSSRVSTDLRCVSA